MPIADLRAQADPDSDGVDGLQQALPEGAGPRDFDGDPAKHHRMDALIAYLQMLGTLVDFKLYDDKANLR